MEIKLVYDTNMKSYSVIIETWDGHQETKGFNLSVEKAINNFNQLVEKSE